MGLHLLQGRRAASCARCSWTARALIDLDDRRRQDPAGDRQGPAASPGARRGDAHRLPRGPPRREDPDAGGAPHRGRRGGARRQGGRRDRAGHARAQHRGAAHGHPRLHHRRRVRAGDRRDDAPLRAHPARGRRLPRRPGGDDHRHDRRPDRGRGAREIEEETELVGEEGEAEGEAAEGEEAAEASAGRRRRGDVRGVRASSADACFRRWRRQGRLARRRASATRASRYARTRHNVGFDVRGAARRALGLPQAKTKYAACYTDGRTGPGGPRVACCCRRPT